MGLSLPTGNQSPSPCLDREPRLEDAQETSMASLSHEEPTQGGGYFAPEPQPWLELLKSSGEENKGSRREKKLAKAGALGQGFQQVPGESQHHRL